MCVSVCLLYTYMYLSIYLSIYIYIYIHMYIYNKHTYILPLFCNGNVYYALLKIKTMINRVIKYNQIITVTI